MATKVANLVIGGNVVKIEARAVISATAATIIAKIFSASDMNFKPAKRGSVSSTFL